MNKFFVIDIPIYSFKLICSIGQSAEEFFEDVDKFTDLNIADKTDYLFDNELPNRGKFCGYGGINTMVLKINTWPTKSKHYGLIQHEIFHAVHYLLQDVGMNLNSGSVEAYTYLVQYLTDEIYKKIWKEEN
jgi:hypothetical protein